jgi:DNA replication protein DnaC
MVPRRFAKASFETYQAETPSEHTALRAVMKWVELVLAGDGPMLALIGPQGTGKSHLLYAATWALYTAEWRVVSRPWYRLADELRYGGTNPYNGVALEPFEVRTQLWDAPVLLLDEVRPTASTAFDDTELAKLACHLYDVMRPMLLTTNVSPLANVLGGPAASRFTQVELQGRDRRQGS